MGKESCVRDVGSPKEGRRDVVEIKEVADADNSDLEDPWEEEEETLGKGGGDQRLV